MSWEQRSADFCTAQTDAHMAYIEAEREADRLQTENARLRELVRISIEHCNSGTCDECPIQGEDGSCPYVDMVRELGVEVEDD